MSGKDREMTIDRKDLQLDMYPESKGVMHASVRKGVRVTHLPSRIAVSVDSERTQQKNWKLAQQYLEIILIADRIEALEAEVARLQGSMRQAANCLQFEINPSNYDHDQVCDMNRHFCEAVGILDAALDGD